MKTNGNHYVNAVSDCEGTLTKRELFAAMAMQGLAGNKYIISKYNYPEIAEQAVMYADNLIRELNEEVQS